MNLRRILYAVLALVVAYAALGRFDPAGVDDGVWRDAGDATTAAQAPAPAPAQEQEQARRGTDALARAIADGASDVQVRGEGVVVRILRDDREGSRHQRFILELDTGDTVLVSHNIDLAPRIEGLREGDAVAFDGEYEWNGKGGVIHWTHHDPAGRHAGGWLEHRGRRYE